MNYYERHLGDYARDTGHLTMLEHGAYSLLLDRYYITEQGIEADQAHRVARARTRDEKAAVDTVLAEFFRLVDGRWLQSRAEGEITEAHKRIETARANGKNGGRPRKQKATQEEPAGLFAGSETETQSEPERKLSKHQAPSTKEKKTSSSPRGSRRCPAEFSVTDEMRLKAESENPGVDLDRETTKFRDWEFAKARSDWPATWRNWIREAFDRLPPRATNGHTAESFRARDVRDAEEKVAFLTGRKPATPQADFIDVEAHDVTPRQLG